MERLMQYIWQNRLYPVCDTYTVDGRRICIVDPGQLNTDAGPDFFNAKVRIDGQMWAGDVEIHVRASDWYRHRHDTDQAYGSVVLHVVATDDTEVRRHDGEIIPQMIMACAPEFRQSYDALTGSASMPCLDSLGPTDRLHLRSWIDALAYERIYDKTARARKAADDASGNWDTACYHTLARALGFGTNAEPFARLAARVPLEAMRKHSDSPLAVEAMLFGQAGLIPGEDECPPSADRYVDALRSEYAHLANKFSLPAPARLGWKMARMRPSNFPHRRIACLAALLTGSGFRMMGSITSVGDATGARTLFAAELSPYWRRHCRLGAPALDADEAAFSPTTIDLLIINVVVPLMMAYGEYTGNRDMCERAPQLLQQLRPESNSIVRAFTSHGLECPDAFTSQALIQLRRSYCEPRKCLYCRLGHRMLSKCVRPGANRLNAKS